jgi:hypothetical protein
MHPTPDNGVGVTNPFLKQASNQVSECTSQECTLIRFQNDENNDRGVKDERDAV